MIIFLKKFASFIKKENISNFKEGNKALNLIKTKNSLSKKNVEEN